MKTALLLAWRYVSFHRSRSGILVAAVALVAFLPIAVETLVSRYEESMGRRAESTPLLVGAKGSRFELLLKALHFRGQLRSTIPYGAARKAIEGDEGMVIPLHLRHLAKGAPVVGTSLEYFEFRGLRPARGSLPLQLGDVVLGAEVAAGLGLNPGDSLITENPKLHDIAASYPLKMHVSGVLQPNESADDLAVFVDLRTAWVIDGLGHGHQKVDESTDPNLVLESDEKHMKLNAAVTEYNEITDENRGSFHFHGTLDELPITAAILVPRSEKADTILNARLLHHPSLQVQRPRETQDELIRIVFRIKRFFDLNLGLVVLATTLFLALVVALTLRLRANEIETLLRIGASRGTIVSIQAVELLLVIGAGVLVAGLAALLLGGFAPRLVA